MTDSASEREKAFDRLVRQEELILDVTEQLTDALVETGVTRAELARRLERSPAFVSQVLRGGRNLTLRTIADIVAALSLRPSFRVSPAAKPVRVPGRWTTEPARPLTVPVGPR